MSRSLLIDSLKVVACQMIVLHHLTIYSPMADWMEAHLPRLMPFLFDHGRLVVQVFLVIGGYLAASHLNHQASISVPQLVWQRYQRLLPHFFAALVLVLLATLWVGHELVGEDWLSPLPTVWQFLAHVFFLQDILGIPSMSAGAWYLAIDLQLFGLFAAASALAMRSSRPLAETFLPWAVGLASVLSLHVFSRNADLDVWAVYYLCAYGLGALVFWARDNERIRSLLIVVMFLTLFDAMLDIRPRPLLALGTSAVLYAWGEWGQAWTSKAWARRISFWSDASYAVFVSHFAMIILISGLWERFDMEGYGPAAAMFFLAWWASLWVGAVLHRRVRWR